MLDFNLAMGIMIGIVSGTIAGLVITISRLFAEEYFVEDSFLKKLIFLFVFALFFMLFTLALVALFVKI